MELKLNKSLFLLFCLLSLVINQEIGTLIPGEALNLYVKTEEENKYFQISFDSSSGFADYINIRLIPGNQNAINPRVLVGKKEDCSDRLYMGTQVYDSIYVFFKTEQLRERYQNEFYLCIKDNPTRQSIDITIEDRDKAYLPVNKQASYFIQDDKSSTMDFVFVGDDLPYGSEITYWVKGGSISEFKEKYSSDLTKKQFDGGFLYYGRVGRNIEISVTSSPGDYIRIGSSVINKDGFVEELLKENANEITVAKSGKSPVCVNIYGSGDLNFITGKIYTITAKYYFLNKNGGRIDVDGVDEAEVYDGLLTEFNMVKLKTEENEGYFCLEDLDNNLIIFSLQFVNHFNRPMNSAPLIKGEIQRHSLINNQWAIFYGMKPSSTAKEATFNMKAIRGFPEMHYIECQSFPNCIYTEDEIKEFEHVFQSNRISAYSFYITDKTDYSEYNPYSEFQPLMIVLCTEGEKYGSDESFFCQFETTYFTNEDTIYLIQEDTFSQYLLPIEEDHYKITFPESIVGQEKNIILEMMLFGGDAEILVPESEFKESNYLSNKVYYKVTVPQGEINYKFSVLAFKKTFYNIIYKIMSNNYDDSIKLDSGINYISSKDREDTNPYKYIYLKNLKTEVNSTFLATFYSPNCEFELQYYGEKVKVEYNKFAQKIITVEDYRYYTEEGYKFYYRLLDGDPAQSPSRYCLVYVAGLEISEPSTWNQRAISLSEGVPHRFIFTEELPVIHYAYHVTEQEKDLVINFNLIDKTYFTVDISIEEEHLEIQRIFRNNQTYIKSAWLKQKCRDYEEVCTVIVKVQMEDSVKDKRVEVTMYQLDGLPFYLEKNVIRDDFVHGFSPKHYYLDIVNGEYGDITLDFKRGSGFIYGNIMPKDIEFSMNYSEWRGRYHFPTSRTEEGAGEHLKFSTYDKKLIITESQTEKCEKGCYVLLTVESNLDMTTYGNENIPFRISILPRIIKSVETIDIPTVLINPNEYIIGSILLGLSEYRKYDYYTLVLPFEGDSVLFDFQADSPALIVNVGDKRPTTSERDFSFGPVGHDTIYKIPAKNITTITGNNTLKGVQLTIGIYSNASDSIQSSPYAFKLFIPPQVNEGQQLAAEIIHVRSDQKVQCSPIIKEGRRICTFAVIFDDMDENRNLIVYPRSQNDVPFTIYGDWVDSEHVERNQIDYIEGYIKDIYPDGHKREGIYIYEENIDKSKSFLFLIVEDSDQEDIIEILSSTYSYEDGLRIYPNPSTAQIFAIGDKNIHLYFMTTQNLLINIVSLAGEAEISWAKEEGNSTKKYLSGLYDRLTLTSEKEENKTDIPSLVVKSIDDKTREGFVFYITYYPRTYIDQMKEGRSTELYYKDVKMPLYYYAKIDKFFSWSININLYDLGLENEQEIEYDKELFNFWATVVSEDNVVRARFDPTFQPEQDLEKSVTGTFDLAFGVLSLSDEAIQRIYNDSEDAYLVCALEKQNNDVPDFISMGLELSIYSNYKTLGINSVPEGIYLNGKISNAVSNRLTYRLDLDKNKPYLRIEFAANSRFINYTLTSDITSDKNDDTLNIGTSVECGRTIITATLTKEYLEKDKNLFFIIQSENIDPSLSYFVFQYICLENSWDYKDYLRKDDSQIQVSEISSEKYRVSFRPINADDVTYYIKAYYQEEFNNDENVDTIAISSCKGKNMLIHNPEYKNTLSYELEVSEKVSYIKVMARVSEKSQRKFYSYAPHAINQNQEVKEYNMIKTEDVQTIKYELNYNMIIANALDAKKKQKYKLVFEPNSPDKIPNYIKIDVSREKGNFSPYIMFSPTDAEAINDRLQLAKGNEVSNEMWIKKEQFINKNFYFVVQCQEENDCGYKINISGDKKVKFNTMRTFSYYVSEGNLEMEFKYLNEFKSYSDRLTLYATGGNNVQITYGIEKGTKFEDGSAFTTKLTGYDYRYFEFSVTGIIGDYITVGAKVIKDDGFSASNSLSPDMGQINGFLNNETLVKECYRLPDDDDTYYITGTVYNGIAELTYLDEELNKIENDNEVTRTGFFSSVYKFSETKRRAVCIGFLDLEIFPKETISYSIQIQSNKNFKKDLYSPQSTGFIYSRIIPSGSLVLFNHLPPLGNNNYMVYNMISSIGYPKMFIYKCTTYPECSDITYDNVEKTEGVSRVAEINRMSTFNVNKSGKSIIDSEQSFLVVKCVKPTEEKYDYCQFMTSIFGDQEDVFLIEKQPFSQYMLPNSEDHFFIDFTKEIIPTLKVHIDFLVISGDVSFELLNADNDQKVQGHKYYLANKIFYSITIDNADNQGLTKIKVKITAKIHSYYIVEYKIIRNADEENENTIYSSNNYLVPIFQDKDNTGNKIVFIQRVPIIDPESIITTFYSLNCKLDIEKYSDMTEPEQLPIFDNYAQDFYMYNKEQTPFNPYFKITVQNYERLKLSNQDICMVYVGSLEIYKNTSGIRKEILVSEGVPQRVSFEDNLHIIRYVYPHANPNKNLTVSIHVIYTTQFKVKIFFRDQEFNTDNVYSQDTVIFIQKDWIQDNCRNNELCSMTVEIENIPIGATKYGQIETTIKQVLNEPYYLQRGAIKNEFLAGDKFLYLYTDIGKDLEGYITVNYNRGSGFIFAKVVKIDQETPEPDANWRNYKFPGQKDETGSLKYDFFNKKILIRKEDTSECNNGCFVLIAIKTSVYKKEVKEFEFQFLTLLADFSPKTYKDKDKEQNIVVLEPEEYIVGSIYRTDDVNEKGLFEYYHVECPYDVDAIEIDWHSNTADLFIKFDEGRPTTDDYAFHYSERSDTNIVLTKEDINRKMEVTPADTSLENTKIVLGVYANVYDSIDAAMYSFRIHFARPGLNIYKVISDQKTICTPTKVNNQHRCLFMVVYQQNEFINDLICYARSQSPSAIVDMYVNFVNNDIFNLFDIKALEEKIPNESQADDSTKANKANFLYLPYTNIGSDALISVISDSPKPIEFYTAFKASEDQVSPNPSSMQVYALDNNQEKLFLDLHTSKSISIKVLSLFGEATFNNQFYLRGADDSFNLIWPKKHQDHDQSKDNLQDLLEIKNHRYNTAGLGGLGFAFILEFSVRGELNIDEIKPDDTTEMIYDNIDFPVYYYLKILDKEKDFNVFFYLHNVIYENDNSFNRLISQNDLQIKGAIVEENKIYEIKNNKGNNINPDINGIYDQAMQTGNIIIKKDKINAQTLQKPTLYLVIQKGSQDVKYKRIRGEVGLNTINGDSPTVQKLYQFGKIQDFNTINVYKLTAIYNNTEYMRIQFSSNSKYVNFAINKEPNKKYNDTFDEFEAKKENGVVFVTFKKPTNLNYLYLNVYMPQDSNNLQLNNFMFKYMNGQTKAGFTSYQIKDSPKVEVKKEGEKVLVSFNPIDLNKQNLLRADPDSGVSVIYTVKLVTSDTKDENANMVSMIESNEIAKQYKGDSTQKITVEFDNVSNYKYAQVVSTITSGSIIEYVSYQATTPDNNAIVDPDPIKGEPTPPPQTDKPNPPSSPSDEPKDEDKTGLYVIIAVSSFLVVVVIVLVVVIIMYNNKNKDLLTQVNKISFVESGATGKDDNNLLMDNQNDLD